jgi:hypothetical protein
MCRDTDKIGGFEVTRVGRRGMLDCRDCFLGVPVALAGVFACFCDVHKLLPFFCVSSGYDCRVGWNVVVPGEIAACLGLIWQKSVTFGQVG